ncbi:MAG: hypothetical protein JXR81_08860 [Candidatus Goldbacteria bacterium]|nr:hypothetical protein [Candidatus Goldiibacteriota bacterium]
MNIFGRGLIVSFSIFLSASLVCAEDYNLSDVITAQENAMAGVEDMQQMVSVETDANGRQDTFSYNMQMKVDEQGKKKVMLTSLGQYQMQILVDEADMSVTYLMQAAGLKRSR